MAQPNNNDGAVNEEKKSNADDNAHIKFTEAVLTDMIQLMLAKIADGVEIESMASHVDTMEHHAHAFIKAFACKAAGNKANAIEEMAKVVKYITREVFKQNGVEYALEDEDDD